MNRSVTDGIIRGFTHGLLTGTSLLANAPDAARALREWRDLEQKRAAGRLPSLDARRSLNEPQTAFELGIHLNLTQGRPLTQGYPAELLDGTGAFCGIGRLFGYLYRGRRKFEPAVRSELAAQIESFIDHGFRPTHLNGHQYIELLPGLRPPVRALVERHGIPMVRVAVEDKLHRTAFRGGGVANWCLAHVKRFYAVRLRRDAWRWNVDFPDAFFGTSHAGRIDLDVIDRFLQAGAGRRLIEIGLHPADGGNLDPYQSPAQPTDAAWHDPLRSTRPRELQMLTSPKLVELLASHQVSLGRFVAPRKAIQTKAA